MAFAPTVQVAPAGSDVTTYEVIAAPPLSTGAVKVTVMLLPLTTAATSDGELGTPEGVAGEVAVEARESPTVVDATALNV